MKTHESFTEVKLQDVYQQSVLEWPTTVQLYYWADTIISPITIQFISSVHVFISDFQ